jgi:ArsR family transcriptional regulator
MGVLGYAESVETLGADQARQLLKALADPVRLQVVQALAAGERCVCDLTSDLNLAQSKLSFHLKVMREAGLIEARVEGRWIYYRLRRDALNGLQGWLGALAAGCSEPAAPCG